MAEVNSTDGLHALRADRLLPTLMDRLMDHAPQRKRDTAAELSITRKQLRQIVLRDLSWLLNATNAEGELPLEGFHHARASGLNFGLPAFSGKRVSNVKLSDLEQAIRRAIVQFEPRIMVQTLQVQASVASRTDAVHNVVIFEIRGHIWSQPYPVEMLLKSSIDLETGMVSLLDQLGDH